MSDKWPKWTHGLAQAQADAERRANRQTAIVIGALAVAVGIIGILIAVL